MALARQPNDEQRRLLRIAARMPLASVANLAPVLDLDEERVRRMLGAMLRGGWVTSIVRGMTERRQHRWFLTRRAVDLLYVTDHDHPAHLEGQRNSPFAAGDAADETGGSPDHEHPPWPGLNLRLVNPRFHGGRLCRATARTSMLTRRYGIG